MSARCARAGLVLAALALSSCARCAREGRSVGQALRCAPAWPTSMLGGRATARVKGARFARVASDRLRRPLTRLASSRQATRSHRWPGWIVVSTTRPPAAAQPMSPPAAFPRLTEGKVHKLCALDRRQSGERFAHELVRRGCLHLEVLWIAAATLTAWTPVGAHPGDRRPPGRPGSGLERLRQAGPGRCSLLLGGDRPVRSDRSGRGDRLLLRCPPTSAHCRIRETRNIGRPGHRPGAVALVITTA